MIYCIMLYCIYYNLFFLFLYCYKFLSFFERCYCMRHRIPRFTKSLLWAQNQLFGTGSCNPVLKSHLLKRGRIFDIDQDSPIVDRRYSTDNRLNENGDISHRSLLPYYIAFNPRRMFYQYLVRIAESRNVMSWFKGSQILLSQLHPDLE